MFANLGPYDQQFFSFSLILVPSESALGVQTPGMGYAKPWMGNWYISYWVCPVGLTTGLI